MADEDDDAQAQLGEQDGEERELGTDSGGAEGQDTTGGNEDSEISTQRTDADEDEGTSPSRTSAKPADEPRRNERYQRLANENRDYKDRLDRLERERELERQQWQRQQQSYAEQQERERIALMTPEERNEYRFTQYQRNTDTRMQQAEIRMAMQMDKANYDAQAMNDPIYRRMAPEVERVFQEQLRRGQPVERQIILENLLGKQALNGRAAKTGSARQQARRRVENERVAPAAGKSSATQTRKLSTAEERLKDVLI